MTPGQYRSEFKPSLLSKGRGTAARTRLRSSAFLTMRVALVADLEAPYPHLISNICAHPTFKLFDENAYMSVYASSAAAISSSFRS